MRKIRKITALLLSVAIISSLCAFGIVTPASAAEETASVVISDDELLLLEKLTSLGVITNNYDVSGNATRREMAEIIAKYIGLPSKGTAESSPFDDVSASDKAISSIIGLYNMGIITGDENGNFHPDSNVTYDEAIVFIINAIGHKMFAVRSGGYPTGYHRIAIQFDMLDDIAFTSGKDKAKVIDIYKMLDSALSAATIETVYYGDGDVQYTLSNTETFLSTNYGIRKYRGKVTGNNFTRLTSHESGLKEEQIEIDGNIYDTAGYNYGYLLGYTVDYYLKDEDKSELVYIEKTPKVNSNIRVDADDILTSETTADRIYYKEEESEKEHHIQFVPNSDTDVIYNSECYIGYGWLENVIPQKGYIEALDNNDDGIYDVLFIYEYDTVIVKSVDTYKETIVDEITGNTIDFAQDVKVFYAENSKQTPFASITTGTILGIPVNKVGEKASKIYVCNAFAEGMITSYDTVKGYEINGEYYKISDDYTGETIALGLGGKFLLDIYGDIVEYNYVGSGTTVLGVPVAIQYEEGGFDKSITLKVFTESGKFEYIPLNEKVRIDSTLYDITDDAEHIEALAKLCGSPDSNGLYKINTSYLIRYAQNKDKKINSIDMGGNGNATNPVPGKLNIFADGYKIVRPSYEKILVLRKDTMYGDGAISRQGKNVVFFMTPKDSEIGDEDKYDIATKLELNKWYASETVTISGDTPIVIDNITAYNFGATDFRTVDAMLVRGGGNNLARGLSATTELNLITNVTTAVNKDEMATGKLYQGTNALGVLAEKVTYTTLNSEGVLQADIIQGNTIVSQNLISEGDVVQLGYNGAGEINAVKLISEYDATTGTITPLFKAAGTYISQVSMFYEPNANFVVGSVDLCDAVAGTLVFTAGVNEDLVAVVETKPTVLIYYSDSGKVVEGMVSDIQPEDKITMRIYNCYTVKEIVVFR